MLSVRRPIAPRRDPAPSRIRYRLTRLWLRPAFRRFVNFGVPMLAGVLASWTLATELDLRARTVQAVSDLRDAIVDRPQFLITEIAVPDVSADLAEQIREASFVRPPVNSLEVSVVAVRDRVEALAAVERARVRALPDGVLEIRAIERIPVVVWRGEGGVLLLDHNGVRVAEVDSRLRRPDLPLVVGAGADAHIPEALAILDAAGPIASRIRGLVRQGERRWDVVLDRDQAVLLPEAEPLAAMKRVIAIEMAEELFDRDLSIVDMRDPARPMLRLSEHAQAELIRLRDLMKGEDA